MKNHHLTFAIGDVHGCSKTLAELVRLCWERASKDLCILPKFVFLGDYVDRGPDSKGVIAFLRKFQAEHPAVVCLQGNHDEMMWKSVLARSRQFEGMWLMNGGVQTLESYGHDSDKCLEDQTCFFEMKSDSEWLRQLPLSVEDARRFYVHAGIRPGIDLEDQTPDDLLWIRYEFLNEILPHPKLIVHGHTPQKGVVDVRNNRVAVDTACVFGYSLSAAVFSDDRSEPIDVIQVPCMDIKEKVNE